MDDSEWFKAFLSVSSRIDYIYHFRYRLLLVRFQICMMYVLSWSTTSELKPVNRLETIWGVCTPHAFAVEFPVLQRVLDNVKFAYRCDIVTVSRIPPIFPALFPLFWLFFFIRVTTTLIPKQTSDCLYLEANTRRFYLKCCLWRKVRPSPWLHQGTSLAHM